MDLLIKFNIVLQLGGVGGVAVGVARTCERVRRDYMIHDTSFLS